MGTKVTYIRMPEPGVASLRGLAMSRSREFKIGSVAPIEWGGGAVCSMEIDLSLGAVVIRKSTPFVGPVCEGVRDSFDAICVPLAGLSQFTIVEDKSAQNSNNQQQHTNNQQRR
jgi:hypothetical protein